MTKTDKFEIKLIDCVKKFKMLNSGDRVLVGLSGGKDSVSLLFALNKLAEYFKIEVFAFHLNHGIRGIEADADESYCKKICSDLGIEFSSAFVDVPSHISDYEGGLEALARDIRYSELLKAAEAFNCNKIATAHTATDNSETLLMTLVRNSNAKGIPPVRDNIIRPLISHTSKEVISYCERHNLLYVTDSTNNDDDYTRNYVRHKILPSIYSFSPNFDNAVLQFSNIQRSNNALVEYQVKRYFDENSNPMALVSLQPLSQDIAFYNVLYNIITSNFSISLSYRQFDDVVALLSFGKSGQMVTLSDGKYLVRGYEELELHKKNEELQDYQFVLKKGKNIIPDSNLVLWLETLKEYQSRVLKNELKTSKINKLTKNILLKYNIIDSSLVARSRKPGDSYVCRGINRSIKKYMIDEKISQELRSRIPVVCDADGIIWVSGLGLADRIKDNEIAGEVFSLSLEYENKGS